MLLFDISIEFQRQLKAIFGANHELYRFLDNHPNKSVALERTCNEIVIYEGKYRTRLSLIQRNKIVKECVRLFSSVAIKVKGESLLSDIQKLKLAQDNDFPDAVKEMADNMVEVDRDSGEHKPITFS